MRLPHFASLPSSKAASTASFSLAPRDPELAARLLDDERALPPAFAGQSIPIFSVPPMTTAFNLLPTSRPSPTSPPKSHAFSISRARGASTGVLSPRAGFGVGEAPFRTAAPHPAATVRRSQMSALFCEDIIVYLLSTSASRLPEVQIRRDEARLMCAFHLARVLLDSCHQGGAPGRAAL